MFEIWAGMCLLVMVSQRGLCPYRTVGGRLPHSVLMQSLHNGWLKIPHCFISYLNLILFLFNLAPLWQQLVLFVAIHYLFSSLSPGFKLTSLSLALAYFFSKPYLPVIPEHALEWTRFSSLNRGAAICWAQKVACRLGSSWGRLQCLHQRESI